MPGAHRIVIVGGGVAGLDLASHIARGRKTHDRFAVTLVDREPAHVWKPMLHTIAAGTADAALQQTPYIVQARQAGFQFEPGAATAIDRTGRTLSIAATTINGEQVLPEREIAYDTLVLACGSRANDFGTPGVAEHCATIDSRGEAIAFNDRLRAELMRAAGGEQDLSVGIVGGGATGVELAAELVRIADIADHYGARGLRHRLRVTLIEAGPRILAPFPPRISTATQRTLEGLGVTVRTSAQVKRVDEGGFELADGSRVDAGIRVWAAGVRAPHLLDSLGDLERSKTGQLVVGPDLVAPGDRHILALGDCAAPRLPGRDTPVPTTAQAAYQQAVYLCEHLPAIIDGASVPDFRYHDFGSLVSLGGYDAYGTLGRVGLLQGGFIEGRVAQLGHALLYRRHQSRLYGLWRGSLLWLADSLGSRVKPEARLGS